MKNTATDQCPECRATDLYETVIDPAGFGGPNLLPFLSSFMQAARLRLVLCRPCGLLRMYASQTAREKLPDRNSWSRIEDMSPDATDPQTHPE
jgi:hypothetical protein